MHARALIPKIHPQFIHSQDTFLFLWKEKSEAGGKGNIVTSLEIEVVQDQVGPNSPR
jgi:hypothetical protein